MEWYGVIHDDFRKFDRDESQGSRFWEHLRLDVYSFIKQRETCSFYRKEKTAFAVIGTQTFRPIVRF